MEPAHLNSPSPDDTQLDEWLRANATVAPLPDAGFSQRVLAALPSRQAPIAWRRALLCVAGALAGAVIAQHERGWPQWSDLAQPLVDAARAASAFFADPWRCAALAVAMMAAAVTTTLVLTLRDDEPTGPQI
jgi:hypothetical protein